MHFFRKLYFHQRFFTAIFLIAVIFLFSFWLPFLYVPAWILGVLLLFFSLLDGIVLFSQRGIEAKRNVAEKLSNSDENPVDIQVANSYSFKVLLEVIDEVPVRFQKRDFQKKLIVPAGKTTGFEYFLRPVERGEYRFGNLNVYISSPLKLLKKRRVFDEEREVKVYPSFIQMKKYHFLAIDNRLRQAGFKKIRRIGHSREFEQIKEYVAGDDVRTINWKATAKRSELMVNQYQQEKAQPVYSILDTGRVMKMPFNGLSLLDYSINSCLAFSNVALQKKDKTGLLTFSKGIERLLPASAGKTQLNEILESLYNIRTGYPDSDFSLLYNQVNRKISSRSLLMLYTNFEHISALKRQLPYLKALAKKHVLLVIFFENTEIQELAGQRKEKLPDIAQQIIAEDFILEKKLMVKTLQQHGIQTLLTKPGELTVNAINKYLEIKSRALL